MAAITLEPIFVVPNPDADEVRGATLMSKVEAPDKSTSWVMDTSWRLTLADSGRPDTDWASAGAGPSTLSASVAPIRAERTEYLNMGFPEVKPASKKLKAL